MLQVWLGLRPDRAVSSSQAPPSTQNIRSLRPYCCHSLPFSKGKKVLRSNRINAHYTLSPVGVPTMPCLQNVWHFLFIVTQTGLIFSPHISALTNLNNGRRPVMEEKLSLQGNYWWERENRTSRSFNWPSHWQRSFSRPWQQWTSRLRISRPQKLSLKNSPCMQIKIIITNLQFIRIVILSPKNLQYICQLATLEERTPFHNKSRPVYLVWYERKNERASTS